MSIEKHRDFATDLKQIAECLDACPQVSRYDKPDEKQSWTIAHDLVDLSESFQKILEEQIPLLKAGTLGADDLNALLLDIGEEFRHIQYHIRNSDFYAYLRE